MSFEIKEMSGSSARSLLDPFYESVGSQGRARDDDHFFLAFDGAILVGAVRYCVEDGLPLLRTMMVAENYRRRGVGRDLLLRFTRYLDSNGIRGVYCIPYGHLGAFYGAAGFQLVDPADVPLFLQRRISEYLKSGKNILMSKKILIPFAKAKYRSQLSRMRLLAYDAVKKYSIRVARMVFVNHGENTTFRVTATNGDKYLLRIHRSDYHSTRGISQELRWLREIAKAGVPVPRPIAAKSGTSVVMVAHPQVGKRPCDIFHWIEGRFLSKSISEKTMFAIGVLLARVQKIGMQVPCDQRRYWASEGLVGENPTFGSVDRLRGLTGSEQKFLTANRKRLLGKLRTFEKKYPERMGFVHADLHFGNLLKKGDGQIAAIDFDDSGYGFHAYDLAVPLIYVEYHLRKHKRFRDYRKLKLSLLAGYGSITPLDNDDLAIIQDLILARKILMLGWLESRSDNPRIAGRLPKAARETIKYFAEPYL